MTTQKQDEYGKWCNSSDSAGHNTNKSREDVYCAGFDCGRASAIAPTELKLRNGILYNKAIGEVVELSEYHSALSQRDQEIAGLRKVVALYEEALDNYGESNNVSARCIREAQSELKKWGGV